MAPAVTKIKQHKFRDMILFMFLFAARNRVPRLPHFTHAARADEREDFVGAKFGAGCEGHFLSRAVQLRTTVKAVGDASVAGVVNRNRLPSGITSQIDIGMLRNPTLGSRGA